MVIVTVMLMKVREEGNCSESYNKDFASPRQSPLGGDHDIFIQKFHLCFISYERITFASTLILECNSETIKRKRYYNLICSCFYELYVLVFNKNYEVDMAILDSNKRLAVIQHKYCYI